MSSTTQILPTSSPDAAAPDTKQQQNAASSFRSSLRTNKHFARWRPSYHLIAPHGWMNDPCAPGFAPSTATYHVGFQWNPNGAEWGDIVWGNAFSSDLVTWEISETPSLAADAPYDAAAVFTGCWKPTGVDGRHEERDDGRPAEVTVAYTSVTHLPIHYTRDYHYGSEGLSVASSSDGGKTWKKLESNPVLPGPPEGVDATGWRDPYIAHWPSMSKLLARREAGAAADKGDLFGIVSGGIRNKTPTTWLYRINPSDLTKWEFIAPLVKPGMNYSPSRWTGDLGVNWEVTNFVSLQDEARQQTQDFLIFGAEGCKAPHGGSGVVPGTKRCPRAQLWVAIDDAALKSNSSNKTDDALTQCTYGGIFDHGLFYAANGFWDPATKQQIVIGWVTEDDLPVHMQIAQGWSGCLSLPRVVELATIEHVSPRASRSVLGELTCIRATLEEGSAAGGLYTVQTLGVKPDPRLQKLRLSASKLAVEGLPLSAGEKDVHQLPLKTARWEACGAFSGVGGSKRVGVRIRHAATAQATVLYFAPEDETFIIERPDLITIPTENDGPETTTTATKLQDEKAPFTLFTTTSGEERLRIQMFYDNSVLEVFVNERVAITTRVYLQDTACSGIEFFAEPSEGGSVVLEEATVWDGLSC